MKVMTKKMLSSFHSSILFKLTFQHEKFQLSACCDSCVSSLMFDIDLLILLLLHCRWLNDVLVNYPQSAHLVYALNTPSQETNTDHSFSNRKIPLLRHSVLRFHLNHSTASTNHSIQHELHRRHIIRIIQHLINSVMHCRS